MKKGILALTLSILISNIVFTSYDTEAANFYLNSDIHMLEYKNDNINSENLNSSDWAKDSIEKAIVSGIVPKELQSDYTDKITRQEFCRLAVQTYLVKTNSKTNISYETPFEDIDDDYVTTAYYLKIVSGINDNEFAPYKNITRQEAAVMLNNLAHVLNVYDDNPRQEKYSDDNYFAQWARDSIYSVTGIKSGDTYVMTGTKPNTFSPWMNYTREQAISTMWRIYNCDTRDFEFVLKNTAGDKYIYFDYWDNDSQCIARLSKNGGKPEILAKEHFIEIKKITDDHIYYAWNDMNKGYISRMNKDGTDSKILLKDINIYDLVISKSNIFYCRSNTVIMADMEGNTISEFVIPDEFANMSINAADGKIVYMNLMPKGNDTPSEPVSNLYKYDFETGKLTDTLINGGRASLYYKDTGVTDGKFIYYKVTQKSGWSQPMESYFINKCDLNKTEEINMGACEFANSEKLFPYGNCMYTTVFDWSANIVRVFANGGIQRITNFDHYYDDNILVDIYILDVCDGTIYYMMSQFDAESDNKSARICSINTDGTNDAILYEF